MAPNTEINIPHSLTEDMTVSLHKPIDYSILDSSPKLSRKRNHDAYMSDDSSTYDNNTDDDEKRGKKPGRRPMNEEFEEEDEDPKIKRKAQNRAAQRAFRERKERYVKELEKKIKYVQDSHVYATTKLYKENEQLRAIVFQLESQLAAFTGISQEVTDKPDTQLIEKKPGQSWLASIGPSVPLSIINSFPSNPLPPLQIRPSPPMHTKVTKKDTDKKKNKKPSNVHSNQQDTSPTLTNNSVPSPKTDDSKQFTFAISTPDTLRANTENDIFGKKEVIQAVQLYPDHSHPANSLLEKPKKYTSSVSSSCDSGDEEDDQDKYSFNNVFDDISEGLQDVLKPFFDTNVDAFYMNIQ